MSRTAVMIRAVGGLELHEERHFLIDVDAGLVGKTALDRRARHLLALIQPLRHLGIGALRFDDAARELRDRRGERDAAANPGRAEEAALRLGKRVEKEGRARGIALEHAGA